MTDTLADGKVITVQSEDGDWTGKKVTFEDGSALPAGEHTLASGRVITVDESGTIASVKEPEAKKEEEPENTEDMKLQEKLTAAEARIKELESALEAQSNTAAKAEAKAKSFENKLNIELPTLKAEIDKLKNTTVGDTTPPAKATKLPFEGQPTGKDPLAEFFKNRVRDVRNTD
jgi:small-conductance mechanosensitive channel